MIVPAGAYTEPANDIIGKEVGNAKFPSPFLECFMGEHVFITVHNRGFFRRFQQQDLGSVQDDHTLTFMESMPRRPMTVFLSLQEHT